MKSTIKKTTTRRQTLSDGRYIVLTTRRAAYTSLIFGKATIYKSKQSYDNGNLLTDGWETITNIYLDQEQSELEAKINEFIATFESTPVTLPSRFALLDEE